MEKINLEDFSLEKLKSTAYDLLRSIQFSEQNLKVINTEIQKRESVSQPPDESIEPV